MPYSKPSLRADLAAGKTRQVIENLIACAAADRDLHTDALALSARYQNYLREKNGGRAEPAWLGTELNQIHTAALDLVERLPEGGVPGSFNWKKWVAIIGSVVAFGAGVAEFSGYSLRDFFKKPEPALVVQPAEKQSAEPAVKTSTSGDNSPAVNAPGGNVSINYGESTPPKPTMKKDSLPKK